MSIVRTFSVFCDGMDGDRPCAQWSAQTTEGAAAARAEARTEGWTRQGYEDFCPAHGPRATVEAEADAVDRYVDDPHDTADYERPEVAG